MAIVTGMTAAKIEEITDTSVVGASIDQATGVLTLQTRDGQTLNVGSINTDAAKLEAVDAAYPVGAIFMSAIATNPNTQLGIGQWQAWGTGRVPIGVDDGQVEFNVPEKVGGSKTHTLTLSEIPRHTHTGAPHTHSITHDHENTPLQYRYSATTTTTGSDNRITDIEDLVGSAGLPKTASLNNIQFTGSSGAASFSGSSGPAGGNADSTTQPHNNLPPYITCYMWKRTA